MPSSGGLDLPTKSAEGALGQNWKFRELGAGFKI